MIPAIMSTISFFICLPFLIKSIQIEAMPFVKVKAKASQSIVNVCCAIFYGGVATRGSNGKKKAAITKMHPVLNAYFLFLWESWGAPSDNNFISACQSFTVCAFWF